MKRKTKTFLSALFILGGNFWLYTRIFWPSTILDTPEMLANLYAKELCTCRYVLKRSPEDCLADRSIIMAPSSLTWDDAKATVAVRVLWAVSGARVETERFGCLRFH